MLGFISPDGKIYECRFYEHVELAGELLSRIYKQRSNNPVDKLCQYGWIVIQSSFVGFSGDNMYNTPKLTREQKQCLEDNKNMMSYDQWISLDLCLEINEMLYQ